MAKPSISLLICTYNRAALLACALESVARSRVADQQDIEVVVIDNNSTDDTRQTVERIRSRGFPFALRYVFEPRQGIAYARTRGLEESFGAYVGFMDDDQRIDPDYLSKVKDAFETTQATCLGGPLLYYNAADLPTWLLPLVKSAGQFYYGDEIRQLSPTQEFFRGGNMFFKREEVMQMGGYNVKLGRRGQSITAGEEAEMLSRLHAAGKRIFYHPELIQYHYLRPERLKKHYWRRQRFGRGRSRYQRYLLKHGGETGKLFLGAPAWLWRSLIISDLPQLVRPLATFNANQAFYNQLTIISRMGQIFEARRVNKKERGS